MKYFGFIYLSTNLINGKKYIGQTSKRFNEQYFGSGKAISKAIKKYGVRNFSREILFVVFNEIDMMPFEQQFIEQFDAINNQRFYNISPGCNRTSGFKGRKHTEETKAKMRLNGLTNHSHKGKKMSKEVCERMSKAKKGISNHSIAQLEKVRLTGLKNKGRKWSAEQRLKIAETKAKKKLHNQSL
jgi:group I intron endonuclease